MPQGRGPPEAFPARRQLSTEHASKAATVRKAARSVVHSGRPREAPDLAGRGVLAIRIDFLCYVQNGNDEQLACERRRVLREGR
jgi:hypothetical protein